MARRLDGRTRYLTCGVVAVGGLLALALSPLKSHSEVPAATPPAADRVPPEVAAASQRVGNAGCAATACHGGPAPSLTSPIDAHGYAGAATHWQARDPHTQAYDALKLPLAIAMMARLNVPKPSGGLLKATEYDRCLACHTDPQLVGRPGVPEAALAQGIGCESCHGHAERYLRDHTTWRTPAERAAGYAATGMAPLYDLGRRAAACAGCHVGAPAEVGGSAVPRDMNHDMIAAGHPRLDGFDFAEAQLRLTPHWSEKYRTRPGQPPRGPDAAWRMWLVGRAACGEASARLLADRAAHGVWPELAESDCRGCHHAIPGPERPVAGGKLGATRWQSLWPLTGGTLAEASELASLAAWMGTSRAPAPAEVTRRATAAAGQLAAWREELAHADGDLRPLARRVFPPSAAGLDADGVLRGLAALERSAGTQTPAVRVAVERFRVTPRDANLAIDEALRDARR